MDDSERLAEALKYYGNNAPNFGNAPEETEIQKILRNLQFSGSGGGGQGSGGMFGGGRLAYNVPIDSTSSIAPYVEGYVGKPKNQPITGGVTGLGVNYRKSF
jgi:hypothetical protein